MRVFVDYENVREVSTDKKGRAYLGKDLAGLDSVKIAVIETDEEGEG